jgi:hypothetical protein
MQSLFPHSAPWPRRLLGALLLAALVLPAPLHAQTRTWRNEKGKKLDATLVGVEGEDAVLANPDKPDITIKYPLSSLVDKDREYIKNWQANRESLIGGLVWGNLVRAKETSKPSKSKKKKGEDKEEKKEEAPPAGEPAELFKPVTTVPGTKIKYYALYFSGKWSPHDRAFTPKLASLYREKGPKTDKSTVGSGRSWEVVLVSADRSAADLAAYMDEFNMPWPALEYEKGLRSPLVRYRGSGLPCLVVVDPEGKVLVDTFKDREFRGPDAALEDFRKLLGGKSDGEE